jgi:hypothetical protein
MTDVFVEQLVKKRMGPKDYAIVAAVILGTIVAVILSLLVPAFMLLIVAGVCFGAYYLISSRSLEFEYSVTNGEITIDKVINRSRRKRILSLDAHDIEDIGKYRPEIKSNKSAFKPYFVSEFDDGREAWYFCARTSKNGNVLVVFSPDERTLDAVKHFLPRQVAFSAFGRN